MPRTSSTPRTQDARGRATDVGDPLRRQEVMPLTTPAIEPCPATAVTTEGAADEHVEQLGVRHAGRGEHPRHLRLLGHARASVLTSLSTGPSLGQEEVDPGDAGAAERVVHRDARRPRAPCASTSSSAAGSRKSALPSYFASWSKSPSTTISSAGGTTSEPSGAAAARRRRSRGRRPPPRPAPGRRGRAPRPAPAASSPGSRDQADAVARAGGDRLHDDRAGPARTCAAVAGVTQAPGRRGDADRLGDQLGRPLVHRERARAGRRSRRTAPRPARRARPACRPRRAGRARRGTTTSQACEHVDRAGQADRRSRASSQRAVAADGQRHDVVRRRVEGAGDRGRRGEGDVVLAVLAAADHGHPGPHDRLRSVRRGRVRRCTRAPMPVTISCSMVSAQPAQSATVGSPCVAGPEDRHGRRPARAAASPRSTTAWSIEIRPTTGRRTPRDQHLGPPGGERAAGRRRTRAAAAPRSGGAPVRCQVWP